ncbi:GntR family transcriptional regulator [Nitratireductor sp. XY-223]|uniref:GntR family transcriptional regulator n=1 Tax=Nitratireductor sp. XY-223 TaxID=2561926 RepID=UPI001FEF6A98|nr:GntR family transcriptional regulator [Nitratireductor sp. XY-223]
MDPSETSDQMKTRSIEDFSGSLANRVHLFLKDAIMSLDYAPGDILRKNDIAAELGVSRSPVSEAFAKLASEGLVEIIPQSGTYVSRFSMDEIREGTFIRAALELAAVEKITAERTDEQLTLLNRNLRMQEILLQDGDIPGFYRADEEMHALILSFTGYRRLAKLAESTWLLVNRARQLILPTPGRVQETLKEHTAIVQAIRDGDPATARITTADHLGQLIKRLEPLERDRPELFDNT